MLAGVWASDLPLPPRTTSHQESSPDGYLNIPPFQIKINPYPKPIPFSTLPPQLLEMIIYGDSPPTPQQLVVHMHKSLYKAPHNPEIKSMLKALTATNRTLRSLLLPKLYSDLVILDVESLKVFLENLGPEIREVMNVLAIAELGASIGTEHKWQEIFEELDNRLGGDDFGKEKVLSIYWMQARNNLPEWFHELLIQSLHVSEVTGLMLERLEYSLFDTYCSLPINYLSLSTRDPEVISEDRSYHSNIPLDLRIEIRHHHQGSTSDCDEAAQAFTNHRCHLLSLLKQVPRISSLDLFFSSGTWKLPSEDEHVFCGRLEGTIHPKIRLLNHKHLKGCEEQGEGRDCWRYRVPYQGVAERYFRIPKYKYKKEDRKLIREEVNEMRKAVGAMSLEEEEEDDDD